MTADCFNSLGLFLDILGVILLFRFGLPQDVRRGGESFSRTEGVDQREAAKAKRYDRMSYGALA